MALKLNPSTRHLVQAVERSIVVTLTTVLFQRLLNIKCKVMIWSQIIYGHRTASISPNIVRFYGARTAPGRRQEESYDF